MEFRIADTFTDSLARLTSDEQAGAKTTAFDLQMNPANPGMQFHKLGRAKDNRFSSTATHTDPHHARRQRNNLNLICFEYISS